MKIPVIRAKIGNWNYYIGSLTFLQISELVKKVDAELHKSESLRDQIQRSITDNYKHIKSYILHQDERFFNSLVLAVYDGEPQWVEVEMNFNDEYFYNMGFLDLNGEEKIFPVDGQHRVEGIKAALLEKPELAKESISVLLIGHKNDEAGIKKTRRMFTTLNRYAKPVKLNDIIALDEDDSVAITTRELLENYDLFSEKRINNAEQKSIPENDKSAITSLITLYECNLELFKSFIKLKTGNNPTKLLLYEKLRYRPCDEDLDEYLSYCKGFWDDFTNNLVVVKDYVSEQNEPARKYRNNKTGGNLIFRPIGLLPIIQTVLDLNRRSNEPFSTIFSKIDKINLNLSEIPWKGVVWNSVENTMIMGNKTLIKLLLLYLYDDTLISKNELQKLKEKYSFIINKTDDIENALSDIK
jgi:DNA sulfur modification protein DndB